MQRHTVEQKTQIYFSRSYRHLKPDSKECLFFLLGCVLIALILFLTYYTKISHLLAVWVKEALSSFIPKNSLSIVYGEFLPIFGGVYYVQVPSIMPSFREITINLAATLLLLFICFLIPRNSKGGTPLSIYLSIILFIHLIAVIFFMFAKDFYPYTATQYSELYIKQQVGIWMSFLVLSGIIIGILGYGSISSRLAAYAGIMTYSFLFGSVRYLTSMYIITAASSLYMATLFFSLGPLFDFLYLVWFYSIYVNIQIHCFDERKGRLKWHWL